MVATCVACLERVARVTESALRGNLNVADAGGNRVPASTTMAFESAHLREETRASASSPTTRDGATTTTTRITRDARSDLAR